MTKIFRAIAAAAIATLLLAGCSTVSPEDLPADAVIIDVRTPAEFAEGHLDGAINIDVQSSEFETAIAALDENDDYLVYCRSGSRAGTAVSAMQDMGFTSVLNIGGLQDASDVTGIAMVTE